MKVFRRLPPFSVAGMVLMFAAAADAQEKGFEVSPQQDITQDWYSGSYALLIGVSDYTNGWGDLPSVPSELTAVEAELQRHGFTVEKHLDPTSSELENLFKSFIHRYGLNSGHRLVFFFSGHGYTRSAVGRQKGYLVPRDAPLPDRFLREFLAKALPISQLVEWSKSSIESDHALFLFDSCFSGTVFKIRGEAPKVPASISARMSKPVRQFISAGSANQRVPARSDFTPLFVRGLSGDADRSQDGYVTASELGAYLFDTVTDLEKGQAPQYGKIQDVYLNAGDVVFRVPLEDPLTVTRKSPISKPRRDIAGVKGVPERAPAMSARAPAWASDVGEDEFGHWASFEIEGVHQKMRWIERGTFLMGSPETEAGRLPWEGPRHQVTLTQGFWLGETEVPQALWQVVMGSNPSRFHSTERPVERVSWLYVQDFLKTIEEKKPGLGLRLPTETEWEYAARAGTQTATWLGDLVIKGRHDAPILDQIAWYGGNSGIDFDLENGDYSFFWRGKQYPHIRAGTHPVKTRQPNPWGLYDMLGNVFEWCSGAWDWEQMAPAGPRVFHPSNVGAFPIIRGGSWSSFVHQVRAAYRIGNGPGIPRNVLGFRLARSPDQEPEAGR